MIVYIIAAVAVLTVPLTVVEIKRAYHATAYMKDRDA